MAGYHNILIVEDEEVFRKIVARNLRARGCVVEEAETAAEAVVHLNRQLPDVMLLDISLPDRSGWDLLRQLQAQGKNVPTIIVSAVRVSQDRLDQFKPLAYLPKPFPLEALLRVVESGGAAADEVVAQ
jgi:DNA-binding response OmpR family regulator